MAQLSFSENAILHIRAVLATQPIVDPVVMVVWSKRKADNARAPDGTVTWKTVEPPHWYACITDWATTSEPENREQLLDQMHGFFVFRDERARSEPGTLNITLTDTGLAVEHNAA